MENLVNIVKRRYPQYAEQITIIHGDGETECQLKFTNPRYSLWFIDDHNGGFIVGINSLHDHFDLESPEENRDSALDYIDDIIQDKVVAIGIKNQAEDFLLAVMDVEDGIESYSQEKPLVEIVSFSRSY